MLVQDVDMDYIVSCSELTEQVIRSMSNLFNFINSWPTISELLGRFDTLVSIRDESRGQFLAAS